MSQNDRIAAYLKKGNSLTPLTALKKFDCWALSSRIANLNARGMNIKAELVKKNGKQFAKYSL